MPASTSSAMRELKPWARVALGVALVVRAGARAAGRGARRGWQILTSPKPAAALVDLVDEKARTAARWVVSPNASMRAHAARREPVTVTHFNRRDAAAVKRPPGMATAASSAPPPQVQTTQPTGRRSADRTPTWGCSDENCGRLGVSHTMTHCPECGAPALDLATNEPREAASTEYRPGTDRPLRGLLAYERERLAAEVETERPRLALVPALPDDDENEVDDQ